MGPLSTSNRQSTLRTDCHVYKKQRNKKTKYFCFSSIAWNIFLFDILVRTSNWMYSRCLLGIYSAKLTWRGCHGSNKGMIWISTSSGMTVLFWYYHLVLAQPVAERTCSKLGAELPQNWGLPLPVWQNPATSVQVPCWAICEVSLPISCLNLRTTISGYTWRSLGISLIICIPSSSLLSILKPYPKLRGMKKAKWGFDKSINPVCSQSSFKSLLCYSFCFVSIF
jgi:hypothetical protein